MRPSSYLGIAFGAATYFGVGLGVVAGAAGIVGILYFERRGRQQS